MYLVKGAHVDRDNVGPETVAAVTPADDGQADPVLQSPSNALLDVSDLYRSNNRGGAVEASLPVFNRLVPLHQWHLRRQLRQRGRILGKGRHNVGRAEQELVWVGFLATAQGAAHLTLIDSDSLVHIHILYDKPRDERSKIVQYFIVIGHANDSSRERSRSITYQAVEV